MKQPKTIKATAVVKKDKPVLRAYDIFRKDEGGELVLADNEKACLVEVKFIKWI